MLIYDTQVFDNIKDLLEDDLNTGSTTRELQDDIGVSSSCIESWLSGRVHAPRLNTLWLVAEYYDYDIIISARKRK